MERRREIVAAFLAASRGGDFGALLELLDPEVVLRADPAAVQIGAEEEIHGAQEVARTFAGRARVAQPALVEGSPGLVWATAGRPKIAFAFTIVNGKIVAIELIGEAHRLEHVDLA
jgi:RNA polymerase sigma-70 factor (ECF subfamily)